MKNKLKKNCGLICLLGIALLSLGCKKNEVESWTEADVQNLPQRLDANSIPPLQVIATVKKLENDMALRIFDAWAKKVLETQRTNPKSPLNQLRSLFNPDLLTPMDIESAVSLVRTEGSGTHGSIARERKPQDYLYHAIWSRIADAAALARYSKASRHMKHYLGNSGKPIRYSTQDSATLLTAAGQTENLQAPDPVGVQIESESLKTEMQKRGHVIGEKESEKIASMTRSERTYYLARLNIFMSLSNYFRSRKAVSKNDIETLSKLLKNKNAPTTLEQSTSAWHSHRPTGRAYQLVSSAQNSDLYYAMGSFTVTHSATPIDLKIEDNLVKLRFAQWKSIFDRYNWDTGKFVTLLSGWCWKTQSDHCFNIEELFTIEVSDKSLSRLHRLGIAREYEIYGQTAGTTVWDGVPLTDLTSESKFQYWKDLAAVLYAGQFPEPDAF